MKVSITQLAWYIERDGWRFQGAHEHLGELRYTYRGTLLGEGTIAVEVPASRMAELEAERDKVAARLARRVAR